MTDWLIITIAVATIWGIWGIFRITFDCIELWQAARRGEDAQAARGTGSSSLWR